MSCAGCSEEDGIVSLDGAIPAFRIVDHERLPPFLMTVVSAWDHWMFVSSAGGLAAGRVEPSRALFPYETDDRLHRAGGITGPISAFRVATDDGARLWEPFDRRRDPGVRRHLTKSLTCDRLEFEEVNPTLGLTFRYQWSTSDTFGFVRSCTIERHAGRGPVNLSLLDGLLNVMPPLVDLSAQQGASCLVDAYKLADRGAANLGIYSLTSRIVDRAEPAEALRGNVVWCHGLEPDALLLSDEQVQAFRDGKAVTSEARSQGRRFAYLVTAELTLEAGASHSWRIVSDVHQSQGDIVALQRRLSGSSPSVLEAAIVASIDAGSTRLRTLVGSADGVQTTADPIGDAHHFANVLFNIMRGGVFVDNHRVRRDDVACFIQSRNAPVYQRYAAALSALPKMVDSEALLVCGRDARDPNLLRLCYEYLPLTFSRRHGDPSRPWNRFAIRVRDDAGHPSLAYEGNWRDIFQNWEALLWSFPGFIEPVIAKFLNASTVDGFNPYRLTRDGVDWEVPEPDQPWSNIGYWGDHQTIYLLKLLETSQRFHPKALDALLEAPIFSYANVPYRIAPYTELVADPHDTISFEDGLQATIRRRVAALGTDGKLLVDAQGCVVHVNLIEKLLVCMLARLSNLVADGGIWMNTQRPEWNDANNALVGNGVSMVTLCYLRRFVDFMLTLLEPKRGDQVQLSAAVAAWLDRVSATLVDEAPLLARPTLDDGGRGRVLDRLGGAFSDYRTVVYESGLGQPESRGYDTLLSLAHNARDWLDHAIVANRRPDGLYHAYNLLSVEPEGQGAALAQLQEMLEGQVAVLSSGLLTAKESLDVIDALFVSAMYREDQRSFTLYPNHRLPELLDRGVLPAQAIADNPLLIALVERGQSLLLLRDESGVHRFHPDFRNASDLQAALDALAVDPEWSALVRAHRGATLDLYEAAFNHRAFTGRSGTMVAYEGLGSIYWHMVSKLLLAIQETYLRSSNAQETARLADAYRRVRAGLSASKTPAEYGAFPTDPYSHTPAHRGAQQPGMTGQVKEEVLCRWGELGVHVGDGQVRFAPTLLDLAEIPDEGIAFTFCGASVRYLIGENQHLVVHRRDGAVTRHDRLDAATSAALFNRTGAITRIDVTLKKA